MAERRDDLRARFDHLRRAVVREPRGHDAVVGALLTPPVHGGVRRRRRVLQQRHLPRHVRTRPHRRRAHARISSAGFAAASIGSTRRWGRCAPSSADDGAVTIENVPARLHARDVTVEVPGYGAVTGDVAWGGNWFFITHARRRAGGPGARARADALHAGDAGRDPRRGDHGRRRRRHRSHRDLRAAVAQRCRCAQLRALLGRRLRSLAVRHGHVGDDGRAARARRARARAAVAAGGHHREPVHRLAHRGRRRAT